ncbi:MAG: DUF4401 domain-containing protein [Paludibacteraceae bacterium]|nr:DUF4401 domain-containing protein [Paludibacteraceae bacterium]
MEFTDKYDLTEGTKLTWPLKLLFYIGGQITMLTLAAPIAGSAYVALVLGLCLIIGSIIMTRKVDNEKLILSVALPLFFSGEVLSSFMLINHEMPKSAFWFFEFCVLIVSWIFCRNHFLRQLILLSIVSVFPLMFDFIGSFLKNFWFYYAILLMVIYGLTIWFDADKFKKENLYAQYIPTLRFCIVVVAIPCALLGIDNVAQSIICALLSFAVALFILSKQEIGSTKKALGTALVLLGCAASCVTPNVSLAVLGLILTYMVSDKFGVVAFGLFLIYSIGKFYYDMEILLSHKSYLLMGSGIIFLLLFFFINRLKK